MHRLAFVDRKGGCGKTTSAVHPAGALAREGGRALLVDLDPPRARATTVLGAAAEEEPTIAARDLVALAGEMRRHVAGAQPVEARSPSGGISRRPAREVVSAFRDASTERSGGARADLAAAGAEPHPREERWTD